MKMVILISNNKTIIIKLWGKIKMSNSTIKITINHINNNKEMIKIFIKTIIKIEIDRIIIIKMMIIKKILEMIKKDKFNKDMKKYIPKNRLMNNNITIRILK